MRQRVHIRWAPYSTFSRWWVHCPCCSLDAWDSTWLRALDRAEQHIAAWHNPRVVTHHPPWVF